MAHGAAFVQNNRAMDGLIKTKKSLLSTVRGATKKTHTSDDIAKVIDRLQQINGQLQKLAVSNIQTISSHMGEHDQ